LFKAWRLLVVTTDSFALGELRQCTQKIHGERYSVRLYYSQPELAREIKSVDAGYMEMVCAMKVSHPNTKETGIESEDGL